MSRPDLPPVPFVDLQAQFASLEPEIMESIRRIASSAAFIRGPALEEFEHAFADLHGVEHAIGVASGTDALNLAVMALDLKPGDEVITVPNTWISTVFAISHAGARPVFVDIDPATYQMDVDAFSRAITPRTRAVIPVHLFGHPAPMTRIVEICAPRGIAIIEDVAQSPLAKDRGRLAGTFGRAGCFSFYPSKNLGAYGDGGMVLTNDPRLARFVRQHSDYGQNGRFRHEMIGVNSRLDTLQAAILLCKLPHLQRWTEARRGAAALYAEKLKNLPVSCPVEAADAYAVYHLYVIALDNRDAAQAWLRSHGILTQVHYPAVAHLQECYRDLGYRRGDFPHAERAADRILSLPIFPEITDRQISRVVDSLAEFLKGQS